MTYQCEYGTCDATAIYRATFWDSQVYHGIDPENNKRHMLLVCRSCAENAMPDTAELVVIAEGDYFDLHCICDCPDNYDRHVIADHPALRIDLARNDKS